MILRELGYLGILFLFLSPGRVSARPPITQKFRYWFSNWGDSHEIGIDLPANCSSELQSYWNPSPDDTWRWKCTRALDCVLGKVAPSSSQMLSTSLVVLGLTPSMLSGLGSSVAESAMLSYNNQALAFLLSIGSPAFATADIWTYVSPLDIIHKPYNKAWRNNGKIEAFIRPQSRNRSLWVLFIEYLLILGAIFNTIHVSLDLGVRSVSTWTCENWWLPLVWVLVPSGIHVLGAASFRCTPKSITKSSSGGVDKDVINVSPPTAWTLLLNMFALGSVTTHVVFGTLVFSSLLFLTVMDALRVVLQYVLSTVVCRFVSQFELMLMSEKYLVKQLGQKSNETAPLLETTNEQDSQKEGINNGLYAA